jgi:hypothetical protein
MALPVCYRIAGAYRLYYASYDTDGEAEFPVWNANYFLGSTGEEGVRSNREFFMQDITSDQMGQGIVDGVYQGSNLEIEFVVQDYARQSVQSLLYPWQTSAGATAPVVDQSLYGTPGSLACSKFGTLWMYPVTGTPAASFVQGGATSGNNAMQFKGISIGPVAENFDTNARFVPVRFRCFPFYASSAYRQFNWIANSTESTPQSLL